jgi:HK97 family phage major capsid protein
VLPATHFNSEENTMTIKELREKRAKLLIDARAIMTGDNVTAEQRQSAAAMLADANQIKSDIEMMETLETETRSTSNGSIPRSQPGGAEGETYIETRSREERRRAANRELRKFFTNESGAATRGIERRDLTVGSNGSVMIPVGVTDPKEALVSYGSIYDVVGKLRTTTGEAVKIPYLNDTSNLFVLNSAGITTTDPGTGGVTSQVDDIRMNPILVEYSLIQDVDFDLVSYIERICSTRYLRSVSKWITLGNTSNVAGLTAAGGYLTGLTANTTLVTKYVDFTGLLAALDPAYAIGACFVMSNATLANQVLNILDSNNRPIFLPFNDGGQSGFVGTIMGYPVKLTPYQPSVGVGNIYIQFGNFEAGYTFREVGMPDSAAPGRIPGQGTVMLRRLDERYAELNKVGFVAFARVGGSITNPGSVGSTAAPVVALIGK